MARFLVWCSLVAALLIGHAAWMFLLRAERIFTSTTTLIVGQILLSLGLFGLMALLRTTPPDARRLSVRASRWWVIGGAAALQVVALALLWPALSEDLVRYRVDGKAWLAGYSPYATSPAELFEHEDFDADAIDRMVTYPRMHTIYPPVSQFMFAVAAGVDRIIAPRTSDAIGNDGKWRQALRDIPPLARGLTFRIVFALAAVACAAVLVSVLIDAGQSPWWATLLAWNPLVVIETGGMGHQDIVGALFLLLMLLLAQRRNFVPAAVMLALACGIKPFAVVLLPFLCRDAHVQAYPAGRKAAAIFALCIALIYLPAALIERGGYNGWLETARAYSSHWEANGSVYTLVTTFLSNTGHDDPGWAMRYAKDQARVLAICAALLTMLLLWQFRASLASAGYWLFLVILLFAPVVYPWYLVWMLALVPLLRGEQGWTGLAWSGTVAISYLLWRSAGWTLSPDALLAEYAPVYALLAIELMSLLKRHPACGQPKNPIADAAKPQAAIGY